MFSIFTRRKDIPGLDWLDVDVHSHLLPGIDDGAPDVKTSFAMLAGLKKLGIQHFIATPHVFKELYSNNPGTISGAYQKLVDADAQKVAQVSYGAEYMLDNAFESLLDEPLICLAKKYVLIEMSCLYESPRIDHYIFELQLRGYQPVLAHPERYRFYHGQLAKLKAMRDRGIMFQVNLLSFVGYYGRPEKYTAIELAKNNLIDFAGTDLHHINHLAALQKGSDEGVFYKYLQVEQLKNRLLLE